MSDPAPSGPSLPPALDAVVGAARRAAVAGTAPDAACDELLEAAGGDRRRIELARDAVAARMHSRTDDFELGATLMLLNRVLSRLPIEDPLDWRVRWTQRFRKP